MVNKNSQLLHNLTLGYNIHDNYWSTFRTLDALLDILSTGEANVPNYGCGRKENLLALLDGTRKDISIQMATLGGTYKAPQINLETASEALSDKSKFPFFYRMIPKEGIQYPAIVQLLLHFRWTLIGLFASDTEKGENFMRTFPPMLVRNGICVVISQLFSTTEHAEAPREALSEWRQVNIFVHFMEYETIWDRILPFHEILLRLPGTVEGKVWILTHFLGHTLNKRRLLKYVHSIWNFAYLTKSRRRCTQKAPLETQEKRNRKRIPNDYQYYSLIQTLAHAMNAAYSSRLRRRRKEGEKRLGSPRLQPWQFHPFLKKNEFCNISQREMYLDQNGEITADMAIWGFLVLPKEDARKRILANFKRQRFTIKQDALSWLKLLNKSLPQSKCVENCHPEASGPETCDSIGLLTKFINDWDSLNDHNCDAGLTLLSVRCGYKQLQGSKGRSFYRDPTAVGHLYDEESVTKGDCKG
ncbi:vomeronasal type-2 receptor 26-like [Ahaetulla prasina]|uniref:vomeronasal type-2 receptor 26-like n=1 Tax=Ahaetulla prasina TaxID=499056 RepID=UPI0026481FDC|nr:vomeronasal type-2 receptor 26-like [Ahaetulla prasina]